MALRTTARLNSAPLLSGEGGLRGLIQRITTRLSTGKILRPDVEDDVLRKPVSESQFRSPAPIEQGNVVVPQGPYKNVFDITYHARDLRRRNLREELAPADMPTSELPPTAGVPPQHVFLGMAGDFDRRK